MNKKGLSILLIIFVLVLGYKFIYQGQSFTGELQPVENAEASLSNALKNEQPTFVEFTSDNCPACRKAKPWIEEMYQDYKNEVNFILADVNGGGRNLAQQMGVTAVPTFIYYDQEGNMVDAFAGYPATNSKAYLEDKIKALVD